MAHQIADLVEHVVDVVPDRMALIDPRRRLTYAQLEAEANQFAHHLLASGLRYGEHVGVMARSSIDHAIALLGCFKARVVPININYRYVHNELDYVVDNAQLAALVHEAAFSPLFDEVLPKHPGVRHVLVMHADSGPMPTKYSFARWSEAIPAADPVRDFGERSADDIYIVYTGGTTGYPKGVMWRHGDVWRTLGSGIDLTTHEYLDEYDQSRAAAALEKPMVALQLGPLMHGNGQWGMLLRLFTGHTVVLLPKFDPAEVWRTIEREGVNSISLIGDAMARPLIEELERGDYDASTLKMITNSSAILSTEVKQRWLHTFAGLTIVDVIGSSETGVSGNGRVDLASVDQGTLVAIGPDAVVLGDDDRVIDLDTEVGTIGRLARTGHIPLGYFADEKKTAETFPVIDGVRYVVPGDFVRVEAGRKLTLLGRGSASINTGGEKVYPEEVESALKTHPAIFDAMVLGLPDPVYGQRVAALVQPREGAELDPDAVRDHLRTMLSGYKLPKSFYQVDAVPRHPTGKADHRRGNQLARSLAAEESELA